MAFDDSPGRRVDGPAEAEADGFDVVLADQRRGDLLDLPADAFGPVGRADVGPLERRQRSAFRGADAELQLGAADFNAEEHARTSG